MFFVYFGTGIAMGCIPGSDGWHAPAVSTKDAPPPKSAVGNIGAPIATLLPSDSTARLGFGHTLALDGDTLLVGTKWAEGGAYIFTRSGSGWAEQAKLVVDNSRCLLRKPALSSGLVAMIGRDSSVHVFAHDGRTWSEETVLKLPGMDPCSASVAVALSNDLLVASVHVTGFDPEISFFRRTGNTWELEQRLEMDRTGSIADIAMQGELAILTGSHNGWFLQRSDGVWKLTTPFIRLRDAAADSLHPPALDGSSVVVGIPHSPIREERVLVFDRQSLASLGSVSSGVEPSPASFGSAVAVDGDTLVTGTPYGERPKQSFAYVYIRGGDGRFGDGLALRRSELPPSAGTAVALSGGQLFVGAPTGRNDEGTRTGAVYVLALDSVTGNAEVE